MHLLFRGTRNGIDCYGTHRGCNEQLGNNHFWEFGQFHSNDLSVSSFFNCSTAWRCNKTDGPCFSHNLPHLLICLTFEQFHSASTSNSCARIDHPLFSLTSIHRARRAQLPPATSILAHISLLLSLGFAAVDVCLIICFVMSTPPKEQSAPSPSKGAVSTPNKWPSTYVYLICI